MLSSCLCIPVTLGLAPETPRAAQQGQQGSAPQQEKDLVCYRNLGVLHANRGITAQDIQSGLGVGKSLYYKF